MSPTILVIGATGMLGEPVARQMKAQGWSVRVFTRSPQKALLRFGEDYEIAAGDVEDPAALDVALRGCQGVHISLDGGLDPDLERRGAECVVQAARPAGIEHVSYLSGASVCPENLWYAGTRARYQAEQAIQASRLPYSIFRAHFFMESLHNFIRGRLALQIGKHPHPYYWVAASDYARMVAAAYGTPAAANKTLYVCGPQALTLRQALQIFCHIAHPDKRLVYMPLWAATLLARLGKRPELQAAIPFFRYCEQVKIILSGSSAEANALLGAPSTTLEEWSRKQTASGHK